MSGSERALAGDVGDAELKAERGARRRGSVLELSGARYLSAAFGLISGPLMARALGPVGRGELASATVYAAVVTVLVSLGVPGAVGNAVANRVHARPAILATIVRFSVAVAPPCLVAALAAVAWPLADLSPAGRAGAFVLIALIPVGVFSSCLIYFFLGEGALRSITILQVAPVVVSTLTVLALYSLGWLDVAAAIGVSAGVSLLGGVIGWHLVGLRPTGRVPLRPILSFAMRGFAGSLATFSTISIDQVIIGPVLGIRELGFYAVAVTVARLPYMVGVSIGFRAYAEVATARDDLRGSTASHFIRLTLLATAVIALAVGGLSPVLLPMLYGRAFVPSVLPLLLLLPGTVALSVSATASSCLNALGLPGRSSTSELLGFVVTLAGLVLVIPRYGIIGAAALSTAAYLVAMVAYLSFLRCVGRVSLRPRVADAAFLVRAARKGLARVAQKQVADRS